MRKGSADRIAISAATTTKKISATSPSAVSLKIFPITQLSQPSFLQRNLRATVWNKRSTPIHRIAIYLRKYQGDKWSGDISSSTRDKIDELLITCEHAEEDYCKDDERGKNRVERKSKMIQMAFKKVQPLIEGDLEKASRQRGREGKTGRVQQRKW